MRTKKTIFYFGHLLKMSTVNKVRIVLTSVGIFVAVFLFSAGIIISTSYYNGNKRIIDEMNGNVVAVSSMLDPAEVKEDFSRITSIVPIEDALLSEKKSIYSVQINPESFLTVFSKIHGITGINGVCSVIDDNGLFLPIDTTLIEGRYISSIDLAEAAEVVIIDELTAQILFPNESALGKTINLNAGVGGAISAAADEKALDNHAEIIGVIKNSRVSETRKLALRKSLQTSASEDSKSILIETSLYCPISTLQKWFPDQETTRYYLYMFDDSISRDRFVNSINTLNKIRQRQNSFSDYEILVKEMMLANIENELTDTKQLLSIIVTILCIISGLSIMSVTFFSVKERIPEIGIRKAFGASKADIVFQFIFEMVSIAFIVSVFAVCLSFYACKVAESFLLSDLFISFNINISVNQLALPVLVGILEAFLCSFFPSLYAANIKVTEALRFE